MIRNHISEKILKCYQCFTQYEPGNCAIYHKYEIRQFVKWLKEFLNIDVTHEILLKNSDKEEFIAELSQAITADETEILVKLCSIYEQLCVTTEDIDELNNEMDEIVERFREEFQNLSYGLEIALKEKRENITQIMKQR